jgi:hypothetical protein
MHATEAESIVTSMSTGLSALVVPNKADRMIDETY